MLKERMKAYDVPQKIQDLGLYPYFRTIESEQDTIVKINGKDVLMFGSNSYLGLTIHPKLKEASKKAIDKYGSGCAGSRFLNGTLDLHLELERRLAKFVEKDGALVFSTGFQVNLGVISSLHFGLRTISKSDAEKDKNTVDPWKVSNHSFFL